MRFIRLKIKTMNIEEPEILKTLINEGFSLTVALPLADIYNKTISHQFVKLSNYDVVSLNEFEFTSLSLYNFKVSEETISDLTRSDMQVMIDDKGVTGTLNMGSLLLAQNF